MARMGHQKRFAGVAVFIVVLSLLPFTGLAADKPLPEGPVRIVYASVSGNMVVGWAAHEGGFFRKQGLDVELVHEAGGAKAVQRLLHADVPFVQSAGPAVLESALGGSGVVILAGLVNTMAYQFMVAKEIARPDQLKGKSLAVSRRGSSSDFATRYALERYGLVPGKDVTIVEIGSQPERFSALVSGKIQGAMLEVPLTLQAKKAGLRVLTDLKSLGFQYQNTALVTTQATIKSRPDLVRKVVKAYVEGIHYYKTHRQEGLAVLEKYLKVNDPEELKETYEGIGLALIPEKPYPTLRGIQNILRELSERIPNARTARPEQFVNTTFLRELDRSGFIDRLYKTSPVETARPN